MEQTEGQVKVKQTKYIHDVLQRFGMENCNPAKTPLPQGAHFLKQDCPTTPDPKVVNEYRSMIGSINYLAVATRPDLALAVSLASQVMESPASMHVLWVKHILKYLKGTTDLGITYTQQANQPTLQGYSHGIKRLEQLPLSILQGYSDSDWAGCRETRRSHSGYVFQLNGGPVSWYSKKQECVAGSSTEAEYIALYHAGQEAVFLRDIVRDMNAAQPNPTVILEDNTSCIQLSKNFIMHNKTKHIDVKYHRLRELVNNQTIHVQQVSTQDQLADFFTKIHGPTKFLAFRRSIMGA